MPLDRWLSLCLTSALVLLLGACRFNAPLPVGSGDAGTGGTLPTPPPDAGVGGAKVDAPGKGGAPGHGGASGTGGAGTGGAGTGGAGMGGAGMGGAGSGGAGTGGAGTGGTSGQGGSAMDVAPELGCGPVCAIFCPNGYVRDERGCPTCKCVECPQIKCAMMCGYGTKRDENGCPTCACNPPPAHCTPVTCKIFCPAGFEKDDRGCEICKCKSAACGPEECPQPAPGAPNLMCPDGSVGGPVCERTDDGRCAWIFRQCPTPPEGCARAKDEASCKLVGKCDWLEPGCTEPAVPRGCYDRTLVNCEDDDDCPRGSRCEKRTMNPCGGLIPVCVACARPISVCL